MRGYDQWKTASPYDEYDDTICFVCGIELVFSGDDDGTEPQYNGFCSKECEAEFDEKE